MLPKPPRIHKPRKLCPQMVRTAAERRSHEDNRLRARAVEFASVALIASVIVVGNFAMVEQALARPLALVRVALGS
jgi:hypothetical protein